MPDRRVRPVRYGRTVSAAIAVMTVAAGAVALALGPGAANSPDSATADAATDSTPTVTVHSVTSPMSNITPHTGTTRTANCPDGTLVGGGGYLRNATDPATLPTNGVVLGGTGASTGSSPVDQPAADGAVTPANWMAIANFTGVAEAGDQATAYALCAAGGPAQTVVASNSTVGANALQQAAGPTLTTATCPAGTTLIGGGAFTSTPDQVNDGTTVGNNGNLKPMGDYPSDASGAPAADGSASATSWTAFGSSGIPTADDKVTAVALCTSDPVGPVQVARVDVSGPDAQPGTTVTTATAVCPDGTQLLGGGYLTDETVGGTSGLQPQQGYHMRGSYPSTGPGTLPADVADGTVDPSAWTALLQAGGQNLATGSSMQLHSFAMCAQASAATSSPTPTTSPTDTSSPTPTPTPTTSAPGATATTTTLKVGVHAAKKGATTGSATPSVKVAPGKAGGTVQFFVDGQAVGGPVAVSGGNTNGPTITLAKGQHSMYAQFTPSDPSVYAPSTSGTLDFTI